MKVARGAFDVGAKIVVASDCHLVEKWASVIPTNTEGDVHNLPKLTQHKADAATASAEWDMLDVASSSLRQEVRNSSRVCHQPQGRNRK